MSENKSNRPPPLDFPGLPDRKTTLQEFKQTMDDALKNTYSPSSGRQYRCVRVCILGWAADLQDSWMGYLFHRLNRCFSSFGYDTVCIYLTQHENTHHFLAEILVEFFTDLGRGDLCIIYYLGHGHPWYDDNTQSHLYLSPSQITMSWVPVVDFDKLRRDLIDDAVPDVLMFFDCPVSVVCTMAPGKEVIAACAIPGSSTRHLFTAHVVRLLNQAVSNNKVLTTAQIFSHLATEAFFTDSGNQSMLRLPYRRHVGSRGSDQIFLAPPQTRPQTLPPDPFSDWGCWPTEPMFRQPLGVILCISLKDSNASTRSDLARWLREGMDHTERIRIEDNFEPPEKPLVFHIQVTFDVWYSMMENPGIRFLTFGRIPERCVLDVGPGETERGAMSLASAYDQERTRQWILHQHVFFDTLEDEAFAGTVLPLPEEENRGIVARG